MQLAQKIRLYPDKQQEIYFLKACGTARFTYNWALSEYKKRLDNGEKPSIYDLKKEFNLIKKESFSWIYDVTKCAAEQSFFNLKSALTNFFRNKKRFKFPKKHKKGKHDSFYLSYDHLSIKGKSLKIPKLPEILMSEGLRFIGRVISATISKQGGYWFISINIDVNENTLNHLKTESNEQVGIDLGVKTAVATSDNEFFNAPDMEKLDRKLRKLHRRVSKKKKGSKNRNKARFALSRQYYKIANKRKDFLHKVTTDLCKRYKLIAIEDLNVSGMLKNHKLAKAIQNMGFGMFRTLLEYKSKIFDNFIVYANRFDATSKTCSSCNWKNEDLTLKDRVFNCQECSLVIDRDYNAAINILRFSTDG